MAKFLKLSLFIAALPYLVFGAFLLTQNVFAQDAVDERALLEAQLRRLEAEIVAYEQEADKHRREGNTLKGEISSLDNKIAKLNTQIQYITTTLARLSREIITNESSITQTQNKIAFQKQAIGDSIQKVYEQENLSLVVVLLQSSNLSDFFDDLNSLMAVQSNLTASVREINLLKDQLLAEKDDLAAKRSDAVDLAAAQEAQRRAVAVTKEDKKDLLDITKGEESKYQELAQQRKQEAAQIRNRLFRLLGGGQMSFEEAYNFAKHAQDLTGVEASFLLATLDRESALGKHVGSCTYHEAMAPGPPESRRDDVTPFLKITADLGLNPETTLVSCPNSDGVYGGAMGPAQFIPTTWILYADKVADLTGQSAASPWANSDAFVASALLLKDNLSACANTGYSGDERIRCAAARYYAGGNYKTHMYGSYGTATLARKKSFDDDISLITQN